MGLSLDSLSAYSGEGQGEKEGPRRPKVTGGQSMGS